MSEESVRQQAISKASFERGRALSFGFVRFVSVKRDGDLTHVQGRVFGNYQGYYQVSITVNETFHDVVDYHCTCPSYAGGGGMCKHCVAMALAYQRDPDAAWESAARSGEIDEASGVQGGSRNGSRVSPLQSERIPARKTPSEAPTNAMIEGVISAYAKKAEAAAKRLAQTRQQAAQGGASEPVVLVPTLAPGGSSTYRSAALSQWTVKFKVQRGSASYVVKSIGSLVDAWENGEYFEYGKNLAFVHSPSAFDERSNRLLELVSRVIKAQQAMHYSYDRYWREGRSAAVKELPLSDSDAIALLDLFQGSQIQITLGMVLTGKPVAVDVVDGESALDIAISPGENGGYDLALPRHAECVASGERMYLVADGKARNCPPQVVRDMGEFYESVLPSWTALHIREKDMPAFCAAVLPLLRRHANLQEVQGLSQYLPDQAEFVFHVRLDEHGFISCSTQVVYGRQTVGLFEPVESGQPVRHVSREMEVQQMVRTFFPEGEFDTPRYDRSGARRGYASSYYSSDPWSTSAFGGYSGAESAFDAPRRLPDEPEDPWFSEDDTDALYRLLTEGYSQLASAGELFVSENLSDREILPPPSISVSAGVRSGLLDISVDAAGLDAHDLMAYLASYRRKQRYVRLASGDIMRLGGSATALDGLAQGLGISEEDLVDGVQGIPANRTLFVDALMKKSGMRFNRNEAFKSIVRDFDTVADGDFPVPETLAPIMRQYQCDGFQWLSMLAKLGFGGILADDMGLGKTLQTIAYLVAYRQQCDHEALLPSLVVCPASLVYNWEAEVRRFAPQLHVATVTGPKGARNALIAASGDHDLLVTSYDLMKRDVQAYAAQRYHCIVLDEAQYIKNRTTKAARAAKELPGDVRFALTGTPIENRLSELWSIFDFLMPGILGSHDSFTARFAAPIDAGDEAVARRLRALVGPFILRRLKGDVLADLPEKNENVVYTHMEGEQGKLYAANAAKLALRLSKQLPEEFASDKLRVLAELTKLRQICCDPHLFYENYEGESAKLETCMELVRNAVDAGHNILLFSQFTSMLDIIGRRLDEEGVAYLSFTGSTSKEERAARVRRFQEGDVPVFLISLKAGGTGLNLTAADIVIHYDPWWNVAAQNQATDRAHRIGQTRNVTVFKLIAKDSIEENILKMQEQKQHLADQVIGGEAVGSSKLSREDVLALLGAAVE